jgi:hypothetical protein
MMEEQPNQERTNQAEQLVCCLAYTPTPKMKVICSPETSVDFTELHGTRTQKILNMLLLIRVILLDN